MCDPTDTPLFRWSYALLKQLPTAYGISSSYGDIDMVDDDEMREAVRAAVEPILRRRIDAAREAQS